MSQPAQTLDTPENWNAASRAYAEKVAPFLMRDFTNEFVDLLDPPRAASVLEVGAGSGAFTEALYPRVWKVVATDFAPEMVAVLRERMAALGATNVTCQVMDGQALDAKDDSFDAAACCFALMLFPDRAKGFRELARVTKPGGRVMVSGWAGPDRLGLMGSFLKAKAVAFPDMPAPTSPPPVLSLADLSRFKAEMEAAGFDDVAVGEVARDMSVTDFDTLWGMMTTGAPPVKMLFDQIGPDGVDRLKQTLHEMTRDRFEDGPWVLTNVATVGTGTAP